MERTTTRGPWPRVITPRETTMIIFGTRSTVCVGEELAAPCPECDRTSMQGFRVFEYLHLYFLPTLPFGGSMGMECSGCLHTRVGKEIPKELRTVAKESTREVRRPRWHWLGSVLLVVLLGWLSIGGAEQRELNLARLSSPVVGDLYVIDTTAHADQPNPQNPFVVGRVTGVTDDAVTVQLGAWLYESSWDAQKAVIGDQADSNDYFGSEAWFFERGDLLRMESDRELRMARRAGEEEA